MILVVNDIEAARDDLIGRGVAVSEIWHLEPGKGRVPGFDPKRRSYFSRASFARPRRQRLGAPGDHGAAPGPGRSSTDVAALAELLLETAERHGAFEAVAPPHDWWDWYAAYMDARAERQRPGRRPRRPPTAIWRRSRAIVVVLRDEPRSSAAIENF